MSNDRQLEDLERQFAHASAVAFGCDNRLARLEQHHPETGGERDRECAEARKEQETIHKHLEALRKAIEESRS